MRMRSGNPVLREGTFAGSPAARGEAMTIQGAVNRALILLALAGLGAATIWQRATIEGSGDSAVALGIGVGMFGGFILALITVFKPSAAPFTAPFYAFLEGLCLGGITAAVNRVYPGIAFMAVFITFITAFGMLALYRAGVLQATPTFRRGVIVATAAIFFFYLLSFILTFFGIQMPFLWDSGPLGILVSLVIVGVAALNLVLDFDLIEQGAAQGAPKHMEWYGAFALMVTLVWLYLEILRLLMKLQRR